MALRRRERGQAAVEAVLMLPWFVLLFAGLVDFGFFAYAFISVQNAAREAALYTAGDPKLVTNANACQYALGEVSYLPNVAATCGTGNTAGNMSATAVLAGQATCGLSGKFQCDSLVSVTYTTVQLFPLPFMAGQFTITRTAQMRIDQ